MDWKNKGWQLFPTRCSLRPVEHHWFRPQKFTQTRGLSQISSDLAGSIRIPYVNRCPMYFFCISNVSLRLAGIGDISGMHNGFQQLQAFSHLHQTSGKFSTSWNVKTDTSRYTASLFFYHIGVCVCVCSVHILRISTIIISMISIISWYQYFHCFVDVEVLDLRAATLPLYSCPGPWSGW